MPPTFTEAMRFRADGGALKLPDGRQHHPIVLLEVQRDATDRVLYFDELTSLHVGAIDAGDAVPHLEDGANLLEVGFGLLPAIAHAGWRNGF